jgi:hypothetical protein
LFSKLNFSEHENLMKVEGTHVITTWTPSGSCYYPDGLCLLPVGMYGLSIPQKGNNISRKTPSSAGLAEQYAAGFQLISLHYDTESLTNLLH